MAQPPLLYAIFLLVALVVFVSCFFTPVRSFPSKVRAWWQARMRLRGLGGVTTLTRALSYNCSLCQESMEAGEKVRTLSCDHAFHCGASATTKCDGVDRWLLASTTNPCPICRQLPQPVPPEQQVPTSSPSASSGDFTEPLLPRAHGETQTLPESSSSAPAPPPARDSEEGLPLLARDASSAPPPPLEHDEQSPRDLEAASPSQ